MIRASILFVASSCMGCAEAGDVMCGSTGVRDKQLQIVGGELVTSSGSLFLREAESLVMLLRQRDGDTPTQLCTGVRVAQDLVLTARHCLDSGDLEAELLGQRVTTSHFATHSSEDVTLLRLENVDCLSGAIATPSPLPPEAHASAMILGFGLDEVETYGVARFATTEIVAVDERWALTDGDGSTGACAGDSGGPLYQWGDDGRAEWKGILIQGSASCLGKDWYLRADVLRPWLEHELSKL